jgi:hypothetical protein
MFKHWFRWMEFVSIKEYIPESIHTKRSDIAELRSIPSALPSGRYSQLTTPNDKDPLRVSYITDTEISYNLSKYNTFEFTLFLDLMLKIMMTHLPNIAN